MPTYDYICHECGHEFELFQQMSASVKRKCPECGKLKLERLIGTGAGVIFKGSGFFETDYRSDSYKKDADAEKKASEKKSDDKKSTSDSTKSRSNTGEPKPKAKSPTKKKTE